MARLLTPADFGLVAGVAAIVGIANIFKDFGLTFATIQREELSVTTRSNLFWVNLLFGAVATACVCAAAWPISLALSDHRLFYVTMAMSSAFTLAGLGAQHKAALNRDLKFRELAAIEVSSYALGASTAISLALLGAGYWSIVAQTIAVPLFSSMGALAMGRWLPRFYQRTVSVRSDLRFGGAVLINQCLNYASKNFDSVAIAAMMGPVALGYYSRAYQLLDAPLTQIQAPATRVVLPFLSSSHHVSQYAFEKRLLRAQTLLGLPLILGFGAMASLGEILVPLALGPGWEDSVMPFQLLALGGIGTAAGYSSYWYYLSTATLHTTLRRAAIIRLGTIVGYFVGAIAMGIAGVALAFAAGSLCWWIVNASRIPNRAVRAALLGRSARNVTASFVAYLCCYALSDSTDLGSAYIPGILTCFIGTSMLVILVMRGGGDLKVVASFALRLISR